MLPPRSIEEAVQTRQLVGGEGGAVTRALILVLALALCSACESTKMPNPNDGGAGIEWRNPYEWPDEGIPDRGNADLSDCCCCGGHCLKGTAQFVWKSCAKPSTGCEWEHDRCVCRHKPTCVATVYKCSEADCL